MAAGQWEQAVGVALEARRLDALETIVGRCPDKVCCCVLLGRVIWGGACGSVSWRQQQPGGSRMR